MGIKDIYNASKIKAENENLKSLMTPEMHDATNMMVKISELQNNINNLQSYLQKRQAELQKMDDEINRKRAQLVIPDDEILVQEFGLYKPTFDFCILS